MEVMKFGGSSIGTVDALLLVKKVVEGRKGDVIVVVSALRGVTDLLLEIAKLAQRGDQTYKGKFDGMCVRHRELLESAVLPDRVEEVSNEVERMLGDLSNIYHGVFLIGDLSQKSEDTIVSYGERLSAKIVAGTIVGAKLYDARKFIKTNPHYRKHLIDFELTDRLIAETFSVLPHVAVVPGFIASDAQTGDATNLGRGGSDYTASAIAAALDASLLEIWTDVDGFMTADPKMVSNAYVIEKLSYTEAIELSNFGAKVIYPPTIFPAYHKNIPIRVKNTFHPDEPGTYISGEKVEDPRKAIKGISSVNDTCLITIQGLGMVGVIGVNYRIFKALAKAGISVFFVSQAASENNISIGVSAGDSELSVEVLSEEFKLEIEQGEINRVQRECGLATIAIVGEGMKHTPGIAGRLFGTLGKNGINVIACAQGASETNISFVITLESLRKAMNVIHDSFFLSEYQVLNIFIAGIGLVGSSLLEQIRIQQPRLKEDNSLEVRVVGVANSSKYLVCRDGIKLEGYQERLMKEGVDSSPELYMGKIKEMNMFNSIFVDCSASEEITTIYKELLNSNVSVVTANKIATSSSYELYESLKKAARRSGVKFLFETNVGAGLPVINTISDLRNSGDKILEIEAVLSGTLNYLFNEMSESVSFSQAIRMAKDAGYAEPDPRVDLSGTDVVRKLVILSREAGYRLEQEDVSRSLFVPDEFFKGSVDDFWRRVPELDADFEQRRKKLEQKGLKWRFIATLKDGKGSVALKEVDSKSPFYDLADSNNVISFTTERYKEYPMQIKGYGAGADVTAAGVFADIISIANIR